MPKDEKEAESAKEFNLVQVITKFAFATRVGYMPHNPRKQNQDAFLLNPNIANSQFIHYFGVCDGHGTS